MPDLLNVMLKWWKTILTFTVVVVVITAVVVFLTPKEYLSTVTAWPTNSAMADRGRIFNQNIQGLYSDLGHPDELDKMIGTAALDTIHIAAAERFGLSTHYKVKPGPDATLWAGKELKENARFEKTDHGHFQIKVWDTDPLMAAQLANFLFQKLQSLHQDLQNRTNIAVIEKIKEDHRNLQLSYQDVIGSSGTTSNVAMIDVANAQRTAILDKLQQYEKLIAEYHLAIRTNPPVLLLVEAAKPAVKADRPNRLMTILLMGFAAVAFSYLLVLFLESRRVKA